MNDAPRPPRNDAVVSVRVMSPYPSVRAGLRVLLADDPRLHVVNDAVLFSEGVGDLTSLPDADVLVVDLPSPEALEELLDRGEQLDARGVVLLGEPPEDVRLLARLGPRPWGLLPREADAEDLATAVLAVHGGLLAIDPGIAAELFAAGGVRAALPALEVEGAEALTPREVEVLSLMSEGIPNKTIARRLGISEHTVKFHVGSVLGKLGAASRTEAVRIGARRGLIAL